MKTQFYLKNLYSFVAICIIFLTSCSPKKTTLYDLIDEVKNDPKKMHELVGKKYILSGLYIESIKPVVKEKSNSLSDANKQTPLYELTLHPYTVINNRITLWNVNFGLNTSLPAPVELINDNQTSVSVYADIYDNTFNKDSLQCLIRSFIGFDEDPILDSYPNIKQIFSQVEKKQFYRTDVSLECTITSFGDWTEGASDDTKDKINNFMGGGQKLASNTRIELRCDKIISANRVKSAIRDTVESYADLPNNLIGYNDEPYYNIGYSTNSKTRNFQWKESVFKSKRIEPKTAIDSVQTVMNNDSTKQEAKTITEQKYYNGCGYSYESKEDCMKQCGSFNGGTCQEGPATGKIVKSSKSN